MNSSDRAVVGMKHTEDPDQHAAAWTIDALRSVWERQQPRVSERTDLIERAITALGSDQLDAAHRRDAERAAHMLAGSLGMFGFLRASEAARELEQQVVHATSDRAPALLALLLRVRRGVRGPVTLCSSSS